MMVAAAQSAAHVAGDGKSTIIQLIETVNEDPRRGYGHENVLYEINIDKDTRELLDEKGYNEESVLKEILYLKSTANPKYRRDID